jgi:NADH dehydrogenase
MRVATIPAMTARPRSLLILGGTGFVGRALLHRLASDPAHAGTRLIVPSRRPAQAKALAMLPGVELVRADVHDPVQLTKLLADDACDAVINLVAILHGSAADFDQVHVQLARKLVTALTLATARAKRPEAVRLLHVSALGVDPNGPPAPSRYLRSKTEAEAVLRSALPTQLTVLRPSVIFGAEDAFVNLFADLQALLPVMPLGGSTARFQPVWVGDVATALQRCLADPSTQGQTFEATGPEPLSLAEIVRLAGRWSGSPRPILPLPEALARLQAAALGCLPGKPLMSGDNIDSMKVPNVASGKLPGLKALGITPRSMTSVMAPLLARRIKPPSNWN